MNELSPRAKAKRDQIQKAAQNQFLENGYSATSMDSISSEAGVSKQTLYTYYPGKEDLLNDVLRQLIQNVPENFIEGQKYPENITELQRLLFHMMKTLANTLMQKDYIALVRVIITETPRIPQLGELFRVTVPEQILKTISALLSASMEKGLIKFDDIDVMARMLAGSIITFVLMDGLFIAGEPKVPDPRRIEEIVDLFINAFAFHSEY